MKLISAIFVLSLIVLLHALKRPCPDTCMKCDGPFGDTCLECKPGYFPENGICRPCHDTCARCNGPFKSDCLPDSLYAILNTQRVLSTGDVTQPTDGPITFTNGYNLYYQFQSSTSSIDLMLVFTAGTGYFATGFGTQMDGASMIICLPSSPSVTCQEYTGGNYVTPTLNSGQYLTMLGYDLTSGDYIVKLNRPLNTGDLKDYVITDGTNSMVWSYHDTSTTLVQHTNQGIYSACLSSSGTSACSGASGGSVSYTDTLAYAHGLIIFFGWGLAVDIGLIFMAIGRKYPFYLTIHSLTMWYTTISTIVVVALLLHRNSLYGVGSIYNAHFGIGLTILGLMILQHIGGIAVLAKSKGKKVCKKYYNMRLGHRVNGTLLYCLAKANVLIGPKLQASGVWYPWIIPIEAVLITLNVLVRVWMRYRDSKPQPLVSQQNQKFTARQQKLVQSVNEGKSREELLHEFPKMKFTYLYNRIYDISRFEHPGGDFILPEITGREVGRFLNGAYHLEKIKGGNPFKHATTDIAILNRYFIGDIIQGENSILADASGKPVTTGDFVQWKFAGKNPLTKSTACFEFQNPNYQVKNDLRGVSWIGRHFYLSKDLVSGPTRPYTVCNSLGESCTVFRNAAVQFFDQKMQGDANFSANLPPLSKNLNFVIKHYHNIKSLPLSGYLHTNLGESGNVLINGPVGRGLEIRDDAIGTHYAFAVGTGILPFMDLLNFLLFKSMYLALKQKYGPEIAKQIAANGADYETPLSGGFKLVLTVAYADNEAIGFDIIRKTAEINSKFNLGLFEALVKGGPDDPYVQKVSSRIDGLFIKEKVGKDGMKS